MGQPIMDPCEARFHSHMSDHNDPIWVPYRFASCDAPLVFKTNYRLKQVKSIAECSPWTFIKLPFVIKIFVLSIFEWPFYTGFTVLSRRNIKLTQFDLNAMKIHLSCTDFIFQ